MTKCATQTLGMIQLMQDFNIVLKGVFHTDSSAALGIVSRVGNWQNSAHTGTIPLAPREALEK